MSNTRTGKRSLRYRVKEAAVQNILASFGRAFEIVSARCPEFQAEIADWEEGRVFSLGVLPDGPAVSLRKEGGRIRYLGKGYQNPQLRILFKNLDSALLPLLGLMSCDTAFAQHRAVLYGSLVAGIQTARTMLIVQRYMFPSFILDRINKRPCPLTMSQLLLKVRMPALLALETVCSYRG